jgi:hypothetical protein
MAPAVVAVDTRFGSKSTAPAFFANAGHMRTIAISPGQQREQAVRSETWAKQSHGHMAGGAQFVAGTARCLYKEWKTETSATS